MQDLYPLQKEEKKKAKKGSGDRLTNELCIESLRLMNQKDIDEQTSFGQDILLDISDY